MVYFLFFNYFFYGRAYSPPRLRRAERRAVKVLDATSWHAPRSGGRKAPRGLIPLGFPRCEKVATLPLCSSFRKNIRFQRLRGQVKETCPHPGHRGAEKARTFAPQVSVAFYNRLLRNQKFCIRASHDARLQRANKTSIFRRRRNGRSQNLKFYIFAPQSGKIYFSLAHCGFPKGIRPFGALLPPLLGARQEVASKTAQLSAR